VEENEKRREEENKGRRRALFQQAQSQRPAELARALETTVSSNVISPYLSFSSFFPVVLRSMLPCKGTRCRIHSFSSRFIFYKEESLISGQPEITGD